MLIAQLYRLEKYLFYKRLWLVLVVPNNHKEVPY